MNYIVSKESNKIKRRNFFYYIGAAAAGAFLFSKFPFNLLKQKNGTNKHSSIKVTENPLAVKRTAPPVTNRKGPING